MPVFKRIAGYVAVGATFNLNSIDMLFACGVSAFFINGDLVFINGPKYVLLN